MNLRSILDIQNKYFEFSKEDSKATIITIVLTAFFFTFNAWGDTRFDGTTGTGNFLIGLVIAAIVILLHHGVQRALGLHEGVTTEFSIWWWGIVLGLFVTILSLGRVSFLAIGVTEMIANSRRRIHRHVPYAGIREYSALAVKSNLAVILLATTAITIRSAFLGTLAPGISIFLERLFEFSLLFVFANLLPFPPLDGSKILFHSRANYVFVGSAFLAFVLLSFILAPLTSSHAVIALFLSCGVALGIKIQYEKNYEKSD